MVSSTHSADAGGAPGEAGGRSVRGVFAICLLLALLVAAGLLFSHLTARPITSVRIAGEFIHVSRSEMQKLVDGHLPSGFFDLDVEGVRREASRIPWVRRVSVRRIWPDSVHLTVVERVAVARWNGNALLGADGTRFVPGDDSLSGDYVDLSGPEGTEESVLERFSRLEPLAASLGTRVAEVALNDRGSWHVELASGLTLKLGQGDGLETYAPYITALPRILGDRYEEAVRIDMRYSNGFAVRWRQKAKPEEAQSS